PDLAREGGKYPNLWHYQHMMDPRAISQGSIMPAYAFMATAKLDVASVPAKLRAMKTIGVPYTNDDITRSIDDAKAQAQEIATDLGANGAKADSESELVALIAYLQRIGRNPTSTSPKISLATDAPAGVR
ncbi:MAG: cbb3-type cytochrome c oxidase subunit II, partial [Polyangiales bacterium]